MHVTCNNMGIISHDMKELGFGRAQEWGEAGAEYNQLERQQSLNTSKYHKLK